MSRRGVHGQVNFLECNIDFVVVLLDKLHFCPDVLDLELVLPLVLTAVRYQLYIIEQALTDLPR